MFVPNIIKLALRQSPPEAFNGTSNNGTTESGESGAIPSPTSSNVSSVYNPGATLSAVDNATAPGFSPTSSPPVASSVVQTPSVSAGANGTTTISPTEASGRSIIAASTVIIIILSLLLALFIGLFVWKLRQERSRKRTASSSASLSEKQPLQGLAFKSNLSTTSSTLTAKIGPGQASLQRATSTTTRASSNASSSSRSTSSYPLATASYAFVPTRPDEISLSIGDRVRVIASFDDGWACVANSEGTRGMVPCECLDIFLLDDESEVWDNYTDVMEKRRSGGSDVTHQTDGTARTGYSERSSSLAFGDASDTSSVSTRSGDILWMVPRRLREV